jgi:integrase
LGINDSLKTSLLILWNKRKSDYVFTNQDGRELEYNFVRNSFYRDQKAAKVSRLGIHGLRHTFASHFMMKNGNLLALKELLGHADIETTMRYAHLSQGFLESKAKVVSWEPKKSENMIEFRPSNHNPTMEENGMMKNSESNISEAL